MNPFRISISLACMAVLTSLSGHAQPRSLGGVFSYSAVEVAYQHQKTGTTFFEFNAGLDIGDMAGGKTPVPGVKAAFTYNFIFWGKDFSSGTLSTYAGVGAAVGLVENEKPFSDLTAGLCGRIGMEYRFQVPVIISLDFSPVLGMQVDLGQGSAALDTYVKGLTRAYHPRIGIRYCF